MYKKIRVNVKDGDVIIPRELLRRAGIRSGDVITISAISKTSPSEDSIKDRTKRIAAIRALWGLWTETDEEHFRREREEMWRSWQLNG